MNLNHVDDRPLLGELAGSSRVSVNLDDALRRGVLDPHELCCVLDSSVILNDGSQQRVPPFGRDLHVHSALASSFEGAVTGVSRSYLEDTDVGELIIL